MSFAFPARAASPRVALPVVAMAAQSRAGVLRALVRRGLLDNRRAPLAWGGALGTMSALVVLLYPSIRVSLAQTMESFPAGVKQAFGITDLGTVGAFLNGEMFSLLLPLAVAYFAIRCVTAAIAGAEEHGYLDTLLATPVARRMFVMSAFVTAVILAAATLLVTGALTAAGGVLAGEPIAIGDLAGALAGVWALALFFAGCATLAAGVAHRASIVLGAGAGLLGMMYLLDVLGKLAPSVTELRWLSAFRYYGTPLTEGLDVAGLIALVAAGTLLATLGAVLHQRRDITG
ncbi:MAG: beta-exotoxin transport system permease protein [bacterium]